MANYHAIAGVRRLHPGVDVAIVVAPAAYGPVASVAVVYVEVVGASPVAVDLVGVIGLTTRSGSLLSRL